jgi:hypothetical protein
MRKATRQEAAASASDGDSRSATWHKWVDVSGKIRGAAALAVVTFLGYAYQSKISMTALINQREQSETQLRASMLHDLIEPVVRREQDNQQHSSDEMRRAAQRDRLLAELVTLNFHDHFELSVRPARALACRRRRIQAAPRGSGREPARGG